MRPLNSAPVYRAHNSYLAAFVLLLFMLGKYHLEIGFSLKPYMVFLSLFLFFHLASFTIQKLHAYEVALIFFFLYYGFTGAFSQYAGTSFRIVLGVILVLGFYFIAKFIFSACAEHQIEQAISMAGIVFNAASLVMYVVGLQSLGFQLKGNSIISYGVMLDRQYPRLIGLVEDPNFYIFYNTLFFAYFLSNLRNWPNKIGFILTILTSMLTLSRGGILTLVLVFVLYMMLKNPLKQWKLLTALTAFFTFGMAFVTLFLKVNILEMMQKRMNDFSEDGGSGRFELWEHAWSYFTAHPIMGIGAGNNLHYNSFLHGKELYAHNTYLQILSESGAIGIFLYLLFLTLVFKQLLAKPILEKKPYLLLAFLSFALQLMSLSVVLDEAFMLYLALLACFLNKETSQDVKEGDKSGQSIFAQKMYPGEILQENIK